jgi:hypothetical protein
MDASRNAEQTVPDAPLDRTSAGLRREVWRRRHEAMVQAEIRRWRRSMRTKTTTGASDEHDHTRPGMTSSS